MKRIRTVEVLGQRCRVVYRPLDDGDWGECCIDTKTITLALKCLDDDEQHWATLAHEVTHMILRLSGLAYADRFEEEAVVRCVENNVIPWVIKNRKLWHRSS